MSKKWRSGDMAVCVLPVGNLELGCLYEVESVLSRGRYRRDGMMGKGLVLCGVSHPHGTAGFDLRRFIRASGIETEGHDRETGHGAEHESPTLEEGDAQ